MKKQLLTAFDRLKFESIQSNDDEELLTVTDILLSGYPVIVNFEKVEPRVRNHMLSFLSGAVYALNGQAIRISDTLFLFGSEDDFKDGTLNQYVEDVK